MKGDSEHACAKISYGTRREAAQYLKTVARKHGSNGLCVYKCKRCPYWHLGRGGKSRKRQLAKQRGGEGQTRGPTS